MLCRAGAGAGWAAEGGGDGGVRAATRSWRGAPTRAQPNALAPLEVRRCVGGGRKGDAAQARGREVGARWRKRGHGRFRKCDRDWRGAPLGRRREGALGGLGGGPPSAAFLEEVLRGRPGPSHLVPAARREEFSMGWFSRFSTPQPTLQSPQALRAQNFWLDIRIAIRTVAGLQPSRAGGRLSLSLSLPSTTRS